MEGLQGGFVVILERAVVTPTFGYEVVWLSEILSRVVGSPLRHPHDGLHLSASVSTRPHA